MKKILLLFVLFALIIGQSFANKAQKIYSVDSDVYKAIKQLYYASGYAVPSASGPWSQAELEKMFTVIDSSSIPASEMGLYDFVRSEFSLGADIDAGGFAADFGFKSVLEAYLQTDGEHFTQRTDWAFDMSAERPFAAFSAEVYAKDHFYLDFEPSFSITYQPSGGYGKINTNIPYFNRIPFTWNGFKDVDVSTNFPMRAMLSAGSDFWNLTVGRDRLSWGQGKTGNIMVSDNLPYYDFARFNLFSTKFKYSFLLSSFPHKSDYYYQKDGKWYFDGTPHNETMQGLNLYLAHRFEARLLNDKLALAVTDGLMYSDANGSIRLATLNPLTFMHNFFMASKSNSTLGFEASFTPTRNLNIYGQFLIDDVKAPNEGLENNRAFAFVGGAEYNKHIGERLLTISAEFAYVDPYTYLRYGSDDTNYGLDYVVATRMYSLKDGIFYNQYVLGYPYGPDCIVGQFAVDFAKLGKYSLGSKLFVMAHGKNNLNTVYKHGDTSTAPSSGSSDSYLENYSESHTEVEYKGILGFNGKVQLKTWLSLYGEVDLIAVKNLNNIKSDGYLFNTQVVVGAGINL